MQRWPTWIAFLFCLTATAVLAARVARTELAEPPPFGREELQAWLTAAQPDESLVVRRRAARQLDRDFHAPFDWQPTFDALPPAEQAAMATNWRTLLTLLVEQRADAYRALPRHRRDRFLDAQLADLMTWYIVGAGGKSSGITMYSQVLAMTPQSGSRDPQKGKTAEFLSALQNRFVQRSLNRVLPGTEPPREREE
jgi:hypothetical protein